MKNIISTGLALTLFLALALTFCTCKNVGDGRVIRNAVTDKDGNHYDAVKIGNQVWMQSNLRTTRFRDGSPIPLGSSVDLSYTQPYYYKPTTQQIPTYDEKTYGLYYNWSAVNDSRGLCPKGWHVPTDAEWTELEEYVGSKSEYVYGNNSLFIAKALASTADWKDNDFALCSPGYEPEKNNATGFTAVPTGYYRGARGSYKGYGTDAYFWSSTVDDFGFAYEHIISAYGGSIGRESTFGHNSDGYYGFSVRCVRD